MDSFHERVPQITRISQIHINPQMTQITHIPRDPLTGAGASQEICVIGGICGLM
jgi:hypothetical protein